MQFGPVLVRRGVANTTATLALTRHHLVLVWSDRSEHWVRSIRLLSPNNDYAHQIAYSSVYSVDRHFAALDASSPLIINGRNFTSVRISLSSESEATEVFANLQRLINISAIGNLFAFTHEPNPPFSTSSGWSVYNPEAEFRRMGLGVKSDLWRFSTINKDFSFCPTYPRLIAVPSRISDNVLKHAVKFRSKGRIPVLSYIHRTNRVTITRCSQPLVGLQQNRSIQDEKL
ncbi:Myotubularin-like phosphatase domain-containing protein, partial [Chytriomyces sp. MP71]